MILYRKNTGRTLGDDKGFTLMELVMAMAVLTFLLAIISTLFLDVSRIHQSTMSARMTQQEARHAMDEFTRRVRFAKTIEVVSAGGSSYTCFTDQVGSVKFRPVIDANHRFVLEQISGGTTDCATGTVVNRRYLTSEKVRARNWNVNVIEAPGGKPSAIITLDVATDTEDLFSGDDCEPGRTGSQYCSTTRFVQAITLRGERDD